MLQRQSIAVIGSGISGLAAAWLLAQRHAVTLIEADRRLGGHSHTNMVEGVPVDSGFIVFNPPSYPNLVALFKHLGVATKPAPMGFSASLDGGASEYSGAGIGSLVGHASNLVDYGHWRMMLDLGRFFRLAPEWSRTLADDATPLGPFLKAQGFSDAFLERHILPMAAAIWSTPSKQVLAFPAGAFFRFFGNHGLLQVRDRPMWRTVDGGSRRYVEAIEKCLAGRIRLAAPVEAIVRRGDGVDVRSRGTVAHYDACVIATHADQALAMLGDADGLEKRLLGAFAYQRNTAVLHRDGGVMPKRRRLWSSWNYATSGPADVCVTYWMSMLQSLPLRDVFVTLNPNRPIADEAVVAEHSYAHPVFDAASFSAQRDLWSLQGRRRTWFCGSYFGYGFHEDGLQSGLAVAEQLGGVRRPWTVEDELGRIALAPRPVLERAS